MSNKRAPFSSVEELLLKAALYEELSIEGRDATVKAILSYAGALDTYCPGCKQSATFRGQVTAETVRKVEMQNAAISSMSSGRFAPWAVRNVYKALQCTRVGHRIDYHFICEADYVVKVGQYPSMGDIEKGDTDKYESVLGRDRLKELNRAIGLASHGVGIGAHVYLRRIFEGLVEEAHQLAKNSQGWDEERYQLGRMADRIKLLKGLVPDFLAENPRLYGILSSGIHELTEQDSLANFDALKLSIEVILDQKLKQKEQQDKGEAARKALAQIDGQGKPRK